MFNSPFTNTSSFKRTFKEKTRFVFVSDLFVTDYVGGAELTSQALIDSCPYPIELVQSKDVDLELLENGHEKYWIFGNFSALNHDIIPTIIANIEYSVLEYDYKFCKYRSPEKHKAIEAKECNCKETMHGKLISAFLYGAKSLWWMSEEQLRLTEETFPFLSEKNNVILSSVFDENFFLLVKHLNFLSSESKEPRSGWIVLGSTSWIKGAQDAEDWCKKNNLEYEVVWNIPYQEVLKKLSTAEGFVYLPKGKDTCPRMVIEAKLLGCKLHLNENVQHAKEEWFDTDDTLMTESYLYAARSRFWNALKATMKWSPVISSYTTTKDCIKQKYPFKQCISSLLGFSNEVVIVDGGSTDGTWEELIAMSREDNRVKPFKVERNWSDKRHAVYDGQQKAEARRRCTGDFLWQIDSDEIVHEDDYEKIINLCRNFPDGIDLISLPVVEYWGSANKVRMDITPWKWRLSRNNPKITHGIPAHLRREDENGELYAGPGTDGCDYIDSETFELIPHASFYTPDVHQARVSAMNGNTVAKEAYEHWFNSVVEQLPGVHHYSWFDIKRKIETYKNYWSSHWQSLYNIEQEDTIENNMFFNKKWEEVTEEDITDMANRLSTEMGGWIFHNKVDFSKKVPHLNIKRSQPKVMK